VFGCCVVLGIEVEHEVFKSEIEKDFKFSISRYLSD
jgi:hypothetical protein